MMLSEAIEAATTILDCYPNGGAQAGDSYIGALAATLAEYPKSVAQRCADRKTGIARECKFLPTVADIVAWCERETEPLRRQHSADLRLKQQFRIRDEFENEQGAGRQRRLTIDELKEKYGDWRDDWRSPGTKARELCEQARQRLVSEIGEDAFNALPEAAE